LGFQAVILGSNIIFVNIIRENTGEIERPRDDAIETMGEIRGNQTELRSIESTGTVTAVVTDVTQVVEAVMPSIVSVSTFYTETYNYFGRQFSDESESSGSGIIVGENDTEILIVTNYHVVQDANTLHIKFVDGSVAEAQVKGSQPNMDLAVIAVNLADLSSATRESIAIATLGNSDTLKVGEPAIAIGNAMGFGQSVTTGVISALDRESSYSTGTFGYGGYHIEGDFIQTDAAINPGNSGGALLNIKGEVIGINSSKIGGTTIEGMGYAIPISAAKPIIAELMTQETRARVEQANQGFLGITGATVDDEAAEIYGLPKGVYISQVIEGTAAEKYGIMISDIITRFGGVQINSMEELQRTLAYYSAGEEVEIIIMRGEAMSGYSEMTVKITLGSR
jgi:serine protease Do